MVSENFTGERSFDLNFGVSCNYLDVEMLRFDDLLLLFILAFESSVAGLAGDTLFMIHVANDASREPLGDFSRVSFYS